MTELVTVVGCVHGMSPAEFVDRMNRLGDRLGVSWRGLVIDNAARSSLLPDLDHAHRWTLRNGGNTDLDFGAYFSGGEWFVQGDAPACLFVNDSLFRLHAAAENLRALLRLWPLLSQVHAPALLGKADPYSTMCLASPWSGLGVYVSSYGFALNRAAAPILASLAVHADADGLVLDRAISDPAWGRGLTVAFREFLRANLIYPGSPYRWRGFSRHVVDEAMLRHKARCIYFEHRLSGEIAREGCLLPSNAGAFWQTRLFIAERLVGLLNVIRGS